MASVQDIKTESISVVFFIFHAILFLYRHVRSLTWIKSRCYGFYGVYTCFTSKSSVFSVIAG